MERLMKNELMHDGLFHEIQYDDINRRVEVPANSYTTTIDRQDFPWSVSIHTSVSSLNDCETFYLEAQ